MSNFYPSIKSSIEKKTKALHSRMPLEERDARRALITVACQVLL